MGLPCGLGFDRETLRVASNKGSSIHEENAALSIGALVRTRWGWFGVGVSYGLAILLILPFFNADGWYGTGVSGRIQRGLQVLAFLMGMVSIGCVGYLGGRWQRIVVGPVALVWIAIGILLIAAR